MNRIIVIGSGGAGKSTFSKKLHKITNLELIHLDVLYWRPNWERTPVELWEKTMHELVAKDKWIIDGNHDDTLKIRLDRADTIIFFDLPRSTCVFNAVKRTVKGQVFGVHRNDVADGCPERFDSVFYSWVWSFNKKFRPKYLQLLDSMKKDKNIIIFKNYSDVYKFLDDLRLKEKKQFRGQEIN